MRKNKTTRLNIAVKLCTDSPRLFVGDDNMGTVRTDDGVKVVQVLMKGTQDSQREQVFLIS